jgi:hypothetical protein
MNRSHLPSRHDLDGAGAAALAPETLGRSLESELAAAVPLLNPVQVPYPGQSAARR